MIKVLMVDDERLLIQGFLHSIDWKSYGYDIVGAVESAKAALELCETVVPDIAILDINMSGMNGLELGGKLKEKNPDLVIIILTAHSEFCFAHEAVRRQFDEYLLKPEIDFEDILETMDRFSGKILAKRKKQMMANGVEIRRIIYERREEPFQEAKIREKLAAMDIANVPDSYACLCVATDNSNLGGPSFELFESKGMDLICDFINYQGILFRTAQHSWVLVQGSENDEQSMTAAESLVSLFDNEGILVTVGVSQCFLNLSQLKEACDQAVQAMSRKFFMSERVLLYQKEPENQEVDIRKINEYIESGNRMLEIGELTGFYTLTSLFLERLSLAESSKSLVMNAFIQTLLSLTKKVRAENGNVNKILGKANFDMFAEAAQCASFVEMESWFSDIFIKLMNYLMKGGKSSKSATINEVVAYISGNYDNPELSLSQTAEHFFISYAYLSQLFSKEMGESFNHYLTRLRMDRAKKLVLDSRIKLAEVAQRSGYNNTSYFIKVFKKETGMTPYEYRCKEKQRIREEGSR